MIKFTNLFKEFVDSEKSGGLVLIFCTLFSLIVSNSDLGYKYIEFWQFQFSGHSIVHWVNDGLMTIFFLLIGLELEREVYIGELSSFKDAMLPIFGAIGGMLVPATLYIFINFETPYRSGAGIPMATDIAFALGILSLLGNRVPVSLKVFLTALAVIDDLGAIIVIALLYTKTLVWQNLLIAFGIFGILLIFNRSSVKNIWLYLMGGILMWYFMLHSGVHATITGVLLAFAIPFGNGDTKSVSYKLQHFLHKPVAFIILPIFALANTCLIIGNDILSSLSENYSIGIILGLVIGKPLGILLLTLGAVFLGICRLPSELNPQKLAGTGFIAGIGFTMSIFITILAFENENVINGAKIAILLSSSIAGILGFIILRITLKSDNGSIN